MGQRTRSRIGTNEGVKTVRVYSANLKTADGYNTFIFRRDVARSLNKLAWAPVIDGSRNPIPEGVEVGGKSVRYSADDKRRLVEFVERVANAQKGPVENDDFGHFEITKVFATEVQCHAISTRREIEAVSSAAEIARSIVHFAGSPNEEVKRKKPNKYFEYGLAKIRLSDGVYLVMGEVGIRVNKRPYYDQRVVAKFKVDSEVTSLHGQTQIGESTFERIYDNRFRLILQGVAMYYDTHSSNPTISNQTIKQSPKFSIIIPVYNVAPYLRECLDSVCVAADRVGKRDEGRGKSWDVEVICVDDGSTDGSDAILDEYARRQSNNQTIPNQTIFHVIHQQNRGEGEARNAGLEAATGEWFCFLDSDDMYATGMLRAGARLIAEHPACDVVRVRWRTFADGEPVDPDIAGADSAPISEVDCGWETDVGFMDCGFCCGFYRRSKFADVRFTGHLVGEDRIYATRCLVRCDKVAVCEYAGYLYRQRPGSITNSKMSGKKALDGFRHVEELLSIVRASGKSLAPGSRRTLVAQVLEGGAVNCRQLAGVERREVERCWRSCVAGLRTQGLLSPWGSFVAWILRLIPLDATVTLLCVLPHWLKKKGLHR